MAVIQRSDKVAPLRRWRTELRDGFVRLVDGERHADFHLVWLRDEVTTDPNARTPESVIIEDEVLRIRWGDGQLSRFPIAWLLQHAYARQRAGSGLPPSNVEAIELAAPAIGADIIDRAFELVEDHGAVVLRRETTRPVDETDAWHAALAQAGFRTIASNVPPSHAVALPAALPEVGVGDDARHYEVLHVRAPNPSVLMLADQRAALTYLSSIDADAARRLLVTPPRPHTRPHLSFSDIESWYRARDLFAGVIREPRHHYRFRVSPGDLVIYDRQRILYGQTQGAEQAIHALHLLGPEPSG